jgi:type I restriction enzyme S subunit
VSGIPSSWVKVCFDDAIEVVSDRGRRIKQKEYLLTGQLPVVDQGEGLIGGYTNDLRAKVDSNGSVIVFGDHTRRFKFVNFSFAVGADGVKLFRPAALWSSKFLYWQLATIDLENRGYGRHYQHLRKESLVLPPVVEQARIVEKLEELLSGLDAGVAELKAAQKKLAQYCQSLLKAAVEGALTADWRANNPPTETGAQLLERILQERRARWEAKQLAKFKEQGKASPKDWQKKYPEPVQPEITDLPELPQGWVWSTLEQLTEFITSGSRGWADYYADAGATFIRSQNINKDRLDLADIAFVNPPVSAEGARTRVQKEDLLLTITGANVGKTARVDIEIDEAFVSQHVALLRMVDSSFSAYLHVFLTTSAGGRGQLDKEAYGAGKPGLNLQQLSAVTVPLPSIHEIYELMKQVSKHLNSTTEQEFAIAASFKQSTAQRQNILKSAFSGQLVPQDPSDEPASELLARIRAERAAQQAVKKPRGRKVKEAA